MESVTDPRHSIRVQQHRSKHASSNEYPYFREKPARRSPRPECHYENDGHSYPICSHRATFLPAIDQRITELDDDDMSICEETVLRVSVNDQQEAKPISRGGTKVPSRAMEAQMFGLGRGSQVANDVVYNGALYPRPELDYTMSGALKSGDKQKRPAKKVTWQLDDEDHVYDANTLTNNAPQHRPASNNINRDHRCSEHFQRTSSSLILNNTADNVHLEDGQRCQQATGAQSWDQGINSPFVGHAMQVPLTAQPYWHHPSFLQPISQVHAHLRTTQGLDLTVDAAVYAPHIGTSTSLLNQSPLTTDPAKLQVEYTQFASELSINRAMQQEDKSILAARPLYPQHMRKHASHELQQLQVEENALLDAIQDIEAEIESASRRSMRAQSNGYENMQQSTRHWSQETYTQGGVQRTSFGELHLEELSLEEVYMEEEGRCRPNGTRYERFSDVVLEVKVTLM